MIDSDLGSHDTWLRSLRMPADTSFASLAERHLGPVLTRAGFAPGQWASGQRTSGRGTSSGWETIREPWSEGGTYCTGASDYIRRYPHLAAGRVDSYGGGHPQACLDIVVEGTVQRGVTSVQVEGEDLTDLLSDLGRTDDAAAVVHAIGGSDVTTALETVASVLQRLYSTA